MVKNAKNSYVLDEQTYEEFVEKVRATRDPTHKKGKKVLIDHCQNVLKYNLNPTDLNCAVRYLEENAQDSAVLAEYKDRINTKEFKAERAEEIVRSGFIDLEYAINYIKENDGNNSVLNEYDLGDVEAFKEIRARDMAENRAKYRVAGRYNPHIHAADDYLDGLSKKIVEKPMEKIVEKEVEKIVFVGEDNIPPENSEAVERNRAWIKNAYKEFEVEDDNNVPAWRRHNADVLDRIKFVDDKGNESEEVRKKSEDTIWEIAKNEVLRERSFDFSFMKLKEEDRLKLLRADLSDSVAKTSMGVVGITPVLNRKIDGEIAAEELAKIDAQTSIKALDRYLSDKGEKAEASQDAVIGAAIHESEVAESFIGYVEKKQYSKKVVDGFKEDHKNFCDKMKSFWGKAWTSAKEYVANNRARVIADTAATLATGLAFVSGVGYAAVGAYAVYAGLGALGWPIEEKRRKMLRHAKKEGRNYNDYKFGLSFNGLRKAWKDIKSDEKELKRYKNRAYTGAAAGVLVAGGLGAFGTGLVTGVDAVAARIDGAITRSLASVTSQYMNLRDTKKDLKLEDNAENRAAYKNAKWGLGIGLTIAALASAWQVYNMLESSADADVKGGKAPQDQANESAQKVAKKTAKVAKKAAEETQPAAEVVNDVAYPPVWNAERGISQRHFEEIYGKFDKDGNWQAGKITGILAKQNKAFEEWNASHPDDLRHIEVKSPEDMYKDMINNLHNAREADPTLFAGKTDDQVMYQYIKLVEYSEKAKNGPVVDGVRTLITVTDANGMPAYASNQEEMQAMFKMLRCGEKVEIPAERLNANLDRIDLNTGKGIGKEFSAKVTGNSFWGFGPDCNDGVSMWKKGVTAVKKALKIKTEQVTEIPREDAVVTTVTNPEPVDANVRSVQVRELESVDGNAQAVYSNAKVVTGRGTSGLHDGDLTDAAAQGGKKVGGNIEIKGTSRKLDGACWVNPKANGGNGM